MVTCCRVVSVDSALQSSFGESAARSITVITVIIVLVCIASNVTCVTSHLLYSLEVSAAYRSLLHIVAYYNTKYTNYCS